MEENLSRVWYPHSLPLPRVKYVLRTETTGQYHWKRHLLFSKPCKFKWFMLSITIKVSEIRNVHRRLHGCAGVWETRGQESLLRLQTLKFRGLQLCMQTRNNAQINKFCKCWGAFLVVFLSGPKTKPRWSISQGV